jgi:hypothetical protein
MTEGGRLGFGASAPLSAPSACGQSRPRTSLESRWTSFNPRVVSRSGHLQRRFKPRQWLDKIALSGQYLIDVLIGHGHFIEFRRL